MRHEGLILLSEIKEIEAILASIPEDNVIERIGFETKLEKLRSNFNSMELSIEPEKTRVTFRGAPVFGSHGIAADFGATSVAYFAEAFAAIVASMRDGLQHKGPIPDKERYQLAITGIAVGSFGFEFQLPNLAPDLFSESGGAEEALEILLTVFEKAADGSDDEVTEALHTLHPRAVRTIVDFLEYIEKKKALCGIEFKGRFFRYSDLGQLKSAKERLKEGNVHHTREKFLGQFQGSLPKPRTFQFQPIEDAPPIMGRFDAAIDPYAINRHWLDRPVTVQFEVVRVGQGHPRFTLLDLADITAVDEAGSAGNV